MECLTIWELILSSLFLILELILYCFKSFPYGGTSEHSICHTACKISNLRSSIRGWGCADFVERGGEAEMRNRVCIRLFDVDNAINYRKFARAIIIVGLASLHLCCCDVVSVSCRYVVSRRLSWLI